MPVMKQNGKEIMNLMQRYASTDDSSKDSKHQFYEP